MPTPEFILRLRESVGHAPLWLSGATAVVLRDGDHGPEVLLVRHAAGEWGPVSGIVDPGEDPHLTAQRESLEEASVVVAVDRLAWLTVTDLVTYTNGDQSRYLDHVFACRWISGDPAPDQEETIEAAFFALTDLPALPPHQRQRIEVVLADRPQTLLGPVPTGF